MLQRKTKLVSTETIEISMETKKFLEGISKRSGFTVGDLIEISWANGFEKNIIYPKECKSCALENWRDEIGHTYEMYEVEVDTCIHCGASGGAF